jgi:hypothetical protein
MRVKLQEQHASLRREVERHMEQQGASFFK